MLRAALAALLVLLAAAPPAGAQVTVRPGGAELTEPESYDRPPPDSHLERTPWTAVAEVGVVIKLAVGQETSDVVWTERWVRDRIIGRIPGGRHIPEQEQNDHPQNEERAES